MYSGNLIEDLLNTVQRAEEHARLEAVTQKVAADASMTFIYELRPQPQAALLGVA